ncbi:MAG: DUF624 domain-containing protein [Clostridia bacterium]|nr:DUF624 domain-containing protein [Clostridia bacterium]
MPRKLPDDNQYHSLDEIERLEQEEINAKKGSKFNLFSNLNKEDADGVSKDEEQIWENPNLPNFFKLLRRKLNQLLSVNILMIFGNFPLFFALFAMSGYLSIHSTSPYFSVFAPLQGVMHFDSSPATAALSNIFGIQSNITVLSTADYVLLALAALTLFTFGPVCVGTTYILRNMFRGEGIFLWHDFWYAIRRNIRQGLIYGIIDLLIIFLLAYDIFFFHLNFGNSTVLDMMFFASLVLAFLYFFMRMYIYLMMVTFDLSILKLLKNALLFTVLGVKRNIMALLGTLAVLAINYFLLALYFPLGVIMPFVIVFSLCSMIGVYAAYPKIKEIMIDPYYKSDRVGETE